MVMLLNPFALQNIIFLVLIPLGLGFILAFVSFAIMEQFFLKTVGLTFFDFRKMAMARV